MMGRILLWNLEFLVADVLTFLPGTTSRATSCTQFEKAKDEGLPFVRISLSLSLSLIFIYRCVCCKAKASLIYLV